MTVKYNVVSYLIGEGIHNLFKNKKSTISALTIMCLCMLVFGIFFMIGENVNNFMKDVQGKQGINVFFKIETTKERIDEIGEQIKQLQGVSKIEYISREEAFNEMKLQLKDNAEALEGMSKERIPESYLVYLADLDRNMEIQEQILQIVGQDLDENGITSSNETINTVMGIAKGVRIFTFGLLVVLVLISIVIISNTIKLTVHARRKEISIMKYVGATNSFIRWPFIVEGIIIGVIAALIAIVIIGGGYNFLVQDVLLDNETVKTLEVTFVTFADMFNSMIIIYLILGMGIGVVGSSISMRKYLEV